MAKNLLNFSFLCLSVTLIVVNIGFIDAYQEGFQKQSFDDASKQDHTSQPIDNELLKKILEQQKLLLERMNEKERAGSQISLWNAVKNMWDGYKMASEFCVTDLFDDNAIVSGTKVVICPMAKKSS